MIWYETYDFYSGFHLLVSNAPMTEEEAVGIGKILDTSTPEYDHPCLAHRGTQTSEGATTVPDYNEGLFVPIQFDKPVLVESTPVVVRIPRELNKQMMSIVKACGWNKEQFVIEAIREAVRQFDAQAVKAQSDAR